MACIEGSRHSKGTYKANIPINTHKLNFTDAIEPIEEEDIILTDVETTLESTTAIQLVIKPAALGLDGIPTNCLVS